MCLPRHIGVVRDEEPPWLVLAFRDADAGTHRNAQTPGAMLGRSETKRASRQIDAVVRARDRHRFDQSRGTPTKLALGEALAALAPCPHQVDSTDGLERADEHGCPKALTSAADVEQPVHSVGEVDVSVSRGTEHHGVARGLAAVRVARRIGFVVGLGLDDAAHGEAGCVLVDQELAQERPGHPWSGAREKGAAERSPDEARLFACLSHRLVVSHRPTMRRRVSISHDAQGRPGIWAEHAGDAFFGLGYLHGRYRPFQTLLLAAAGRGQLAKTLLPRRDLIELDALIARLGVVERAAGEATRLSERARTGLDAYCEGVILALERHGRPFELALIGARLPPPDRQSLLGTLAVSAFLGLAQCQERMERLLVDLVRDGADPALLEQLHAPHLAGWAPEKLARVRPGTGLGHAAHGLVPVVGGSNAWTVDATRSSSGAPLLAGDPHLQVNQLPSLFFEVRARVGSSYWLGASIPGLPGVAVGRNRHVAWSGTFAVADNVDFALETLQGGRLVRGHDLRAPVEREVEIGRRFLPPVRLRFFASERGTLDTQHSSDGCVLASRWAGSERWADCMDAYLGLPMAASVSEAVALLDHAPTLSLHFVLADRSGAIRYAQVGRIPRRRPGYAGLAPWTDAQDPWLGVLEPGELPRAAPTDGVLVTANEARPGVNGEVLSTLAQPEYRRARIEALLAARRTHDLASMRAIQLDLVSGQAERLVPRFLAALERGPLHEVLAGWDHSYDAGSLGAHAFERVHRAALAALAPRLGRGAWTHALGHSEVGLWWLRGLDAFLSRGESWTGELGTMLRAAVRAEGHAELVPWGEARTWKLPHLVLGGLPRQLGFDRGPLPLVGSPATVCQGTVVQMGDAEVVVAPAYRFVTDLSDDAAWTSLPGGIDGSPRATTYDQGLVAHQRGEHTRLAPPDESESREELVS